MTTVCVCPGRSGNRRRSLIRDQRGAVALEMPFVYGFMILSLLVPLADVAIAGFRYISAWEALRGFGQSIQYFPPPDVTDASNWKQAALAKADPKYPISDFQLICGDNNIACSTTNLDSTNPAKAKFYTFKTSITLTPILLQSVLCTSSATNPCTFTLSYSERFQ